MHHRSILLALLSLAWLAPCDLVAAEKPNVLFIAIDDLNDWVGFLNGHPQVRTPNMDRIARRGVVFSNAQCPSPLCCPSRAAVFSGRQPYHTGVYENHHEIRRQRPELPLLPRYLAQHGYHTYGTGKLLHRRSPELFDEHFFTEQRWSPLFRRQVDYTPDELPNKVPDLRHVVDLGPNRPDVVLPLNRMPSDRNPTGPTGESFDWGPFDFEDEEMGDGKVTSWAVERLEGPAEEPFFLAIGYYRPHIPLWAPRRYFEIYPADRTSLPETRADDLDDLSEVGKGWALEPVTAGAHATVVRFRQWHEAVAAYLACVSFVDAQIGRLLDALDRSPHAENTVIILWSDHGWHLGEKQHWGKWTGWERSTRVPLVVAPPATQRDSYQRDVACAQPVSLIDLYPTILEMCDVPAKEDLDGASLVPFLQDPTSTARAPVICTFGYQNYAVRTKRWKMIRYREGGVELYDHERDPREWHNLARDERFASTIDELEKWLPKTAEASVKPR